jgi:hypothetical protein
MMAQSSPATAVEENGRLSAGNGPRSSPEDEARPRAEREASGSDEDDGYGDQEDARTFLEPAISPMATRLTSPWTPAAEKAAAIEDGIGDSGDGFFGPHVVPKGGEAVKSSHVDATTQPSATVSPGVSTAQGSKSSMSTVLGQPRQGHGRSSSVGSDALKRLSKALPSISLPSGFLNSIQSPTFFSSKSASHAPHVSATAPGPSQQESAPQTSLHFRVQPTPERTGPRGPPSVASRRSHVLRKSMSAESLLYHQLSRVSSYADEDKYEKIRDQGNARLRAIIDSLPDVPFKMPQLPQLPSE